MSKGERLRDRRRAIEFRQARSAERAETLEQMDSVEVVLPLIGDKVSGTMTMRRATAETLLDRGVIREHDGQFFADDREIVMAAIYASTATWVCDFCSERECVALYPAQDAPLMVQQHDDGDVVEMSAEGWAACAACDRLVQDGSEEAREQLVERAVEMLADKHAVPREQARFATRAVQSAFWTVRTGERRPL